MKLFALSIVLAWNGNYFARGNKTNREWAKGKCTSQFCRC